MVFCNWFSSFEKEVQATCLTWFKGLSSLKWNESIASNDKKSSHFLSSPRFVVFVIKQLALAGLIDSGKFVHKRILWIHPGWDLKQSKFTVNGLFLTYYLTKFSSVVLLPSLWCQLNSEFVIGSLDLLYLKRLTIITSKQRKVEEEWARFPTIICP